MSERPDDGAAPLVSAVVVNWNGGTVLHDTVSSLASHPPAGGLEILVIDNASTDGSIDAVERDHPAATVIRNATNRGLSAANNQGIVASRGEFILISNPDITYGPGSVDALVELMHRRPRAAFAFARPIQHGHVQTAAGDLPRLRDALLGRQIARRRANGRQGFWWDGWAHDEEVVIGHGLEACFLVRRAALADIGPLDERFPLDWEGVDWCARAWDSGWEVWFCPTAEVLHLGGVSLRQAQYAWVLRSHRSMYRYFAKRSGALARPWLALAFAARAGVKLVGVRIRLADYASSHPGSEPTPER